MPLSRNGGAKLQLFCRSGKLFSPFVLNFSDFCVILAPEMKKTTLSILIPTYNGDCRAMVSELQRQAAAVSNLDYEIIVIDDGSPDRQAVERLRSISQMDHCRFTALDENIGRSRIRNVLARMSRCEWLIFLDCDMTISKRDFIQAYLSTEGDVIYGGYEVGEADRSCLRYRYEKAHAHEHTADQRRQRPYQHFHTSNFLIRRDIMLANPFDETFRNYGYEDVLLGKQLKKSGIAITHIQNPAGFCDFEDNAHFVSKTEEGLRTLSEKRDLLRGYSQLLTFAEGIHSGMLRGAIRLWHKLLGGLERRILCSRHPSLRIFSLYKLGYFLCITSQPPAPYGNK